jgi:short-subunit dehydrogenase
MRELLDELAAVVAELRGLGVRAEAVPADLFDLGQTNSLIDRSEAALGPLDGLVNNTGVESAAAFTEYTREELTSMVDLNLTAPLLLTHRVVPGMLERARGHVVFIASVAGKPGPAYQLMGVTTSRSEPGEGCVRECGCR